MAEKNNATCSICGKEYYKCMNCKGKKTLEPYKMYCCSSEHYKIYQVLHGFNTKVYTKDEAREKLQTINLSDLNTFRDNIKKQIKEITKEDKRAEKITDLVSRVDVAIEMEDKHEEDAQVSSYINRKKKSFVQEDCE